MDERVYLDSLDDKNRAREFKACAKDMKSKDLDTRKLALSKINNDIRYFSEGLCLKSLIESLLVSKKTMELSKVSMESLVLFLEKADKEIVLTAVNQVLELAENIPVFQCFADFLIFRESLKIPKQKKNDPTPLTIPIEQEIYGQLRTLTIRTIYLISKLYIDASVAVSSISPTTTAACQHWSKIPNIYQNICDASMFIKDDIKSETKSIRYGALKCIVWLLTSLECMMKYDDSSAVKQHIVAGEGNIMMLIAEFTNEPVLAIQALKLYDKISSAASYLSCFDNMMMIRIVSIMNSSAVSLRSWHDQQALLSSKAKPTPKKEIIKPKKGEIIVVDEYVEDKLLIAETHIISLAQLSVGVNIMCRFTQHPCHEEKVTESMVMDSAAAIRCIFELPNLWTLIGNADVSIIQIPLKAIVEQSVIYVGILASLAEAYRVILCNQGILSLLCQVFKTSGDVYRELQYQDSMNIDMKRFRTVLEKSILILSIAANADTPSSMSSEPSEVIASPKSTTSSPLSTSVKLVIDVISPAIHTSDPDLARRGIRILSKLTMTNSMKDLNIDTLSLTNALASIFESCGRFYLSNISTTIPTTATTAIVDEQLDDVNVGDHEVPYKVDSDIIPLKADDKDDMKMMVEKLCPTEVETCYDAINLISSCIDANNDNIIAFVGNVHDTNNRIYLITKLLSCFGPTSSHPMQMEHKISCYQLHRMDWLVRDMKLLNDHTEMRNIRPAIMNMMKKIIISSCCNEMIVSIAPGTVPTSSITYGSSYEDHAIVTCIACIDVCCNLMFVGHRYQLNRNNEVVLSSPDETQPMPLEHDVLLSSMQFMHAVGRMGITGLCASLESIAKIGFETSYIINTGDKGENRSSSMSSFNGFIQRHMANHELNSTLCEAYTWTRPKTYQFLEPQNASSSLMELVSLSQNKTFWPFIMLSSTLISKINDPRLCADDISLAMNTAHLFLHSKEFDSMNQHITYDAMATAFLGLGGGITIAGLCGRFGSYRHDTSSASLSSSSYVVDGLSMMKYLIYRGITREKFWLSYYEEHKEVIEYDAKGKPKSSNKKKDKPIYHATLPPSSLSSTSSTKKKESSKKSAPMPMLMDEVVFAVEPDYEVHMDPNHGPSSKHWTRLLDTIAPDSYTHAYGTTLLNVMIVSRMASSTSSEDCNQHRDDNTDDTKDDNDDDMIVKILNLGVDVNAHDEVTGMSPLMYALLLGHSDIVQRLVGSSSSHDHHSSHMLAQVNRIDAAGNPLLKYAFMTISSDQLDNIFKHGHHTHPSSSLSSSYDVVGHRHLLKYFQRSDVDVNISDDVDGNYPLHWALGLCSSTVMIAGYTIIIRGSDYTKHHDGSSDMMHVEDNITHDSVLLLDHLGAEVNICNKHGVAPLHVVALKGDLYMMKHFISSMHAFPNIINEAKDGYLPFHYLALGCPYNVVECYDYLSEVSKNLPVEVICYHDSRKMKTQEVKYGDDMNMMVDNIINSTISPSCIMKKRYTLHKLLLRSTVKGENIMHVLMAGHCFAREDIPSIHAYDISSNKHDRMIFLLHLLSMLRDDEKIIIPLLQGKDKYDMTIMHAMAILFDGITPKTQHLTQKELLAKRVKKYESIEKQIIDIISSTIMSSTSSNYRDMMMVISTRPVINRYLPTSGWTIFHGAIAANNYEYADHLLHNLHFPLYTHAYLHHIASFPDCCYDMAKLIISAYTKSTSPHSYTAINGIDLEHHTRPIHLAVNNKNTHVLKEILKSSKTNLNLRDENYGCSAFHLACIDGDMNVLDEFASYKDRIDLLVEDIHGDTCIEACISSHRSDIFHKILRWRKNDVIERVSCSRGQHRDMLLLELERENIRLVELLKPKFMDAMKSSIHTNQRYEALSPKVMMEATPTSGGMLTQRDAFDVQQYSDVDIVSAVFQSMRIEMVSNEPVTIVASDPATSMLTLLVPKGVEAPGEVTDDMYSKYLDQLEFNSEVLQSLLAIINDMKDKMAPIIHVNECYEKNHLYQESYTLDVDIDSKHQPASCAGME